MTLRMRRSAPAAKRASVAIEQIRIDQADDFRRCGVDNRSRPQRNPTSPIGNVHAGDPVRLADDAGGWLRRKTTIPIERTHASTTAIVVRASAEHPDAAHPPPASTTRSTATFHPSHELCAEALLERLARGIVESGQRVDQRRRDRAAEAALARSTR